MTFTPRLKVRENDPKRGEEASEEAKESQGINSQARGGLPPQKISTTFFEEIF